MQRDRILLKTGQRHFLLSQLQNPGRNCRFVYELLLLAVYLISCTLPVLAAAPLASESSLSDSWERYWRGNYQEAREGAERRITEQPDDSAAYLLLAACQESVGAIPAARQTLQQLTKSQSDAVAGWRALAKLEFQVGDYKAAQAALTTALTLAPNDLLSRWQQVQLQQATGQTEQIDKALKWFILYYNQNDVTDAVELTALAQAATAYATRYRLHDQFDTILNELLDAASSAMPSYWPAHWVAGQLLLEKYNEAEGVPELKEALRINPRAVPVLVSLATQALRDHDANQCREFCQQALQINPKDRSIWTTLARLHLQDKEATDALAEAHTALQQALAANPVHEETLGLLAGYYTLTNQPEAVEQLKAKVIAQNAKPARFYFALAEALDDRMQYLQAVPLYRQASELDPHWASPLNNLGMLLMRLGKEEEAKPVFEQAFARDPFHVRVANMRRVLTHLEAEYQVFAGPHYEVYVAKQRDELLGQYALDFLEKHHAQWCQHYGYEVPGKTRVEFLKTHEWFSGRIVGLPGVAPVAASTGAIVALTAPASLDTPYNWQRVLTHEMTHVITLQQTQFRISHWFTEALAVLSENSDRPEIWDQLLKQRVPANELFTLETLSNGFIRPKSAADWQMAYCQSLLYARYMQERFGRDALMKMLTAFTEGLTPTAAIPAKFSVSVADFESGYRDYLQNLVAKLAQWQRPELPSYQEAEQQYQANPDNPTAAANLAWQLLERRQSRRARELAEAAVLKDPTCKMARLVHAKLDLTNNNPESAIAVLTPIHRPEQPEPLVVETLATAYLTAGKWNEAAPLLELLHRNEPSRREWVKKLAALYLKLGVTDKLEKYLIILAQQEPDHFVSRKKLMLLAKDRNDWPQVAFWANEALGVNLYDVDIHLYLAQAATQLQDWPVALRESDTLTRLQPNELSHWLQRVKLLQQRQEDQADQVLRWALRLFPNEPQLLELQAKQSKSAP